jgi:hypothetical protein
MYRVELFEHGKWRKCTYDKKNFEFLIDNNLKTKTEIRNFPYKPYFFHRIKWSFIKLWKWIKKTDPKLKKIQNSAFFAVLLFISMFFIKHYIENEQKDKLKKYEQEMKLKDQTIQNYEAFSDSLLTEIKKKELIIKGDFELFHQKDSTLMNDND